MKVKHLSVETLEDAVSRLSTKLADIKIVSQIDTGQKKAPKKQDYQNAMLAIQRIIEN